MIFARTLRRELTNSSAAVFVALFAIMLSTQSLRLLKDAAGGELRPEAVLAMLGFAALNYLPVLLALTIFIATLLTLSRAWSDSEMVVWFSSGLSLYAWMKPVLFFTLPITALVAVSSLLLTPWALSQSEQYRTRLENKQDTSLLAPGAFREAHNGKLVLFAENIDKEAAYFRNVFVTGRRSGVDGVVVAAQARQETKANGEVFIVLEDGRRYEVTPGKTDYKIMQFERYTVRTQEKKPPPTGNEPRNMPLPQLLRDNRNNARAELVWRLGLPLTTISLALLAIPLSFVSPRSGRSTNLAIAVLTFSIYYNLLSVVQRYVAEGSLPFFVGWWLLHAMALGLFVVMLFQRVYSNTLWQNLPRILGMTTRAHQTWPEKSLHKPGQTQA